MKQTWICDFCGRSDNENVYEPAGSLLGTRIVVCRWCGLVASVYKKTKKPRVVSTSSAANWGNIRHGKGLRFEAQKELLTSIITWNTIGSVLDIGSNRGHFVEWVKQTYPSVVVSAIEPDQTVITTYSKRVDALYKERYENVKFPDNREYDVIYCSHTLEHSASAIGMLRGVYSLLSVKGVACIEVPNIEVIGKKDLVEEYFIDKHTFHFHEDILRTMLEYVGLSIIKESVDQYNITFFVKKTKLNTRGVVKKNARLIAYERILIQAYKILLENNRSRLKAVANNLNIFSERQKVVYWGGGRIFDALVQFGGLDVSKIHGVVDSYLSKYVPIAHGVALKSPNALRLIQPDVVIILAQSSASEIEKQVRSFGIRHVIPFAELFKTI